MIPNLEDISAEITGLPADIRAEIVLEQLLQKGVSWDEVITHADKFFYRDFSRDLFQTYVDTHRPFRDLLHLHLSRRGLFDRLPEGLFFQPAEGYQNPKSAAEMVQEYKASQRREQEIRTFFCPLEHEFFYHRLRNQQHESQLVYEWENGLQNDYFVHFWGLPPEMPAVMALHFILFMPYIHQIAGDIEQTAACLSAILNEPVAGVCSTHEQDTEALQSFNQLGAFHLGDTLTCGTSFQEEIPVFMFTIGALQNSQVHQYLEGGSLYSTLQTFYRFFIPANVDVQTHLQVSEQKSTLTIGTLEEATLGISTIL